MSDIYLHYKKNNINLLYLCLSFLLILFGFYKNGILLYKEYHNKVELFKPFIFPLISISIPLLLNFIKTKKISLNDNCIYLLLLSLCIPMSISIILFLILIVTFGVLLEFVLTKININVNYIALFKLIIIALLYSFNKYIYANPLEAIDKYSYNIMDIFIGRGISGICSSSIIIILISYVVLSTNYYYKKEILPISLAAYIVPVLIFRIFFHKVIIFNSLILFSLVFIAPINKFSPAFVKEKYIYSVVVGLLTFIATYYVNANDGVVIAIFISSFLNFLNLK